MSPGKLKILDEIAKDKNFKIEGVKKGNEKDINCQTLRYLTVLTTAQWPSSKNSE